MRLLLPLSACLFFASCTSSGIKSPSAPIVMGDSSTIVTETDTKYLKSAFADYTSSVSEEQEALPEIPQPAASAPEKKLLSGGGVTADFGEMQVFISNLKVRNADADGKGKSSLSYSSDGSAFNARNLTVAGASRAAVKQKTDYQISLVADDEKLLLTALGKQSTGWKTLSGDGETFTVTSLQGPEISLNNSALRRAAQQALRTANTDRQTEKEILRKLNNANKTDGETLLAKPMATIWQITAKGAKGKTETREIRVDW